MRWAAKSKPTLILLSAFVLLLVLLTGTMSASAVDQYTATYLLDLYQRARAELLSLVALYEGENANNDTAASIGGLASTGTSENITSTEATSTVSDSLATNYTETLLQRNETLGNENATETNSVQIEAEVEMNGTRVSGMCLHLNQGVTTLISRADGFATAAKASLQAGNYRQAAKLALKALNIIGKAYVHLSMCLDLSATPPAMPETPANTTSTNTTGHARIPPGLFSALLRHKIRLSRLEAAIEAAESSGVNVSSERDIAKRVEILLNQSEGLILIGDVQGAVKLMTEANNLMSQIVRALKTSSVEALVHRHYGHDKNRTLNVPEPENVNVTELHEQRHGKGASQSNKTVPVTIDHGKGKEKEEHGREQGKGRNKVGKGRG